MHDDQLSKVHLGIALGHTILNDFKQNTDHPLPVMMSRIVTWKDERSNKFGDALPTSKSVFVHCLRVINEQSFIVLKCFILTHIFS